MMMSEERDSYMRAQDAHHDMLRMRQHVRSAQPGLSERERAIAECATWLRLSMREVGPYNAVRVAKMMTEELTGPRKPP